MRVSEANAFTHLFYNLFKVVQLADVFLLALYSFQQRVVLQHHHVRATLNRLLHHFSKPLLWRSLDRHELLRHGGVGQTQATMATKTDVTNVGSAAETHTGNNR